MCRDVDMSKLEGVIFDNACGLDAYILNREPREFQYLRCLVDGSHWQGQKKLKKPNKSGKGDIWGVQRASTLIFTRYFINYYQAPAFYLTIKYLINICLVYQTARAEKKHTQKWRSVWIVSDK